MAFLARLRWLLLKQERVGSDLSGNIYYRTIDKEIERRFVRPVGGWTEYDPHAVPPEWSQWLHKTRKEAPTVDDLSRGAAARAESKAKAEQAESKDAIRRLQEKAMDQNARQASTLMQQLTGKE